MLTHVRERTGFFIELLRHGTETPRILLAGSVRSVDKRKLRVVKDASLLKYGQEVDRLHVTFRHRETLCVHGVNDSVPRDAELFLINREYEAVVHMRTLRVYIRKRDTWNTL